MRTSFLMLIVAAGLAFGAGGLRAADESDEWLDVAVYVDDPDTYANAVRSTCASQLGTEKPAQDVAITTADGATRRLLVYRVRNTRRWGKSRSRSIENTKGVAASFVNSLYRARGTPTSIPIIDGDLEPRVILQQAAMSRIRMAGAQAVSQGAGKVVAIIDGGFDLRHECLQGKVAAGGMDLVDHDSDPQDLGNGTDDDADGITDNIVGHGTMTASLVLAGAPGAKVLPLRVLDDEGWGSPIAVIEAINYAVASGAHVINMSLVIPVIDDPVRDAVRAALDAGVVVVSSAGNGPIWQQDPQLAKRVITVGATDDPGEIADFSNTGSSVHVYAPGVGIVGALGGDTANDYGTWQGTSFSAPFVSATAALFLAARSGTTPEEMRSRLMSYTIETVEGALPTSRGELDAQAVLQSAGN